MSRGGKMNKHIKFGKHILFFNNSKWYSLAVGS